MGGHKKIRLNLTRVQLRCNEVQDSYYVPTLYQYQLEIEDGYRRDGSPVRIGYDDTRFPDYSWRGYGSYSQLQNEVRTALRQLTH